MKHFLFALILLTGAYSLAQAKTILVPPAPPTQLEIELIVNKPYLEINHKDVGSMRFAVTQSSQSGFSEVLYAPPRWYKKPWDQKGIYRIGTAFKEIQSIAVRGDYLVLTGKREDGGAAQISALFKQRIYPQGNLMVYQGLPPVAKDPKILDVSMYSCTTESDVFVPRKLIVHGQKKEGAFNIGIIQVRYMTQPSRDFFVHPNGEVEVRFDSGASLGIGKVDLAEMPKVGDCGQVIVEIASKPSFKHTKRARPLMEGTILIPIPVFAKLHDVRFGFEGQEIQCKMILSRDETVSYSFNGELPGGFRQCDSSPL